MSKLKSRELPRLEAGRRHSDGGGLFFKVPKSGNGGSWVYVYRRLGGKGQTEYGLGTWPDVSLDEARKKLLEAKALRAKGVDPKEAKAASARRSKTFEDIARAHWSTHVEGHVAKPSNWIAGMERYVFPTIGAKSASAVTVDDLDTIFRPIWHKEHARKLRQWVGAVLLSAETEGENVDARLMTKLKSRLGKQKIKYEHQAAIPVADIPRFYASLPHTATGLSMRVLVLSGLRVEAVTGLLWSEVDLKSRIVHIPPERVKGWRVGFRVPLTTPMAIALHAARRLWPDSDIVFPSPGSKTGHLSNNIHRIWMQKNGWKDEVGKLATAHGLRSAYRSWMIDQGVDFNTGEFVLQHVTAQGSTVAQAYSHQTDILDRRREIADRWSEYVTSEHDAKLSERRADLGHPEGDPRSKLEVERWTRGDKEDWFEE